MKKINFVNGETIDGASTFNTMQDNIEEAIEEKQTYSTSEQKIGSWLGKNIYRKVVNIGKLPNATSKSVEHNISNLDHYVKIWGIAYASASSKGAIPLPYVHFTTTNSVVISADITYVSISTGADRSIFNGFVVLEYTKTTD